LSDATRPRGVLAGSLRLAALAGAVLFLLAFAFMALRRVPYPFELEWMEGGSLEQVRRILSGQPLYARPGVEYVSYRYAPLYFYVSAAVAALVGQGFLGPRLVSFLASCGSLALVFRLVGRETGSREAGLLAAGLFAATARLSGFWSDVARVDALYLYLLLLAAWWIRRGRSPLLVGAVLALAFHTKQTALLPAAGYVAYYFWRRRPQAAALLATLAAGAIGGALLADALSGGWYSRFVFRPHWLLWHRVGAFWTRDLLASLPVAAVAAVFYLSRRGARDHEARVFYAVFALLMVGTAFYSRLIVGAYLNALLPACAALAVLFGLALHEARQALGAPSPEARAAEAAVWAAAALQFAVLAFNPLAHVPTHEDAAAGARLVGTIAGLGGDVLVPGHPYLVVRAGGRGHAHAMAIGEVFLAGQTPFARELKRSWQEALCQRRFAGVLTGRAFQFQTELEAAYRLERPLHELGDAFFTVAGSRTRPELLYLPRDVPLPPCPPAP
jgi:4-amino-4-deoxy-L-arabinose transferase-like glycosyltransferase